MPASKTLKSESRLSFRLPESAKQRIEKAATIAGLTTTDFAINTLVTSADKVLESYEIRILTDRDRDLLLSMLSADRRPNKALKNAATKYKKSRAK